MFHVGSSIVSVSNDMPIAYRYYIIYYVGGYLCETWLSSPNYVMELVFDT